MASTPERPNELDLEVLDLLRMGPESTDLLLDMVGTGDAETPYFEGEPITKNALYSRLVWLASHGFVVVAYREGERTLVPQRVQDLPESGGGAAGEYWWKVTEKGRAAAEAFSS